MIYVPGLRLENVAFPLLPVAVAAETTVSPSAAKTVNSAPERGVFTLLSLLAVL